MFGNRKKRKFVVMDGSDKKFLEEIIGNCEMIIGRPRFGIMKRLFGMIRYRRLDKNHPTMMVFTIKSNYADWDLLRKNLTRNYPAQVVFDAVL